jgi:hypothetical protein
MNNNEDQESVNTSKLKGHRESEEEEEKIHELRQTMNTNFDIDP